MKHSKKLQSVPSNLSLISALNKLSGNKPYIQPSVKILNTSPLRFLLACDSLSELKQITENPDVANEVAVNLIDRSEFPAEYLGYIRDLSSPGKIMESMVSLGANEHIPEIEGYVLDFIEYEVDKFNRQSLNLRTEDSYLVQRGEEICEAIFQCFHILNINPSTAHSLLGNGSFTAKSLGMLFKNLFKNKESLIETMMDFISIGNIQLIDNDISLIEFLTTYEKIEKLTKDLIEVIKSGNSYYFFNIDNTKGSIERGNSLTVNRLVKDSCGNWLCEHVKDLDGDLHDIRGSIDDLKRLSVSIIEHIEKYQ